MRIKCPHCNGKGFSEINSALNMTCGWCMGQGELDLEIVPTEQTTNEDFLRTATTEQLAEELLAWWIDGADTYTQFGLFQREIDEAKERIVKWLKEKHNGIR
jgi:hypothetical protein